MYNRCDDAWHHKWIVPVNDSGELCWGRAPRSDFKSVMVLPPNPPSRPPSSGIVAMKGWWPPPPDWAAEVVVGWILLELLTAITLVMASLGTEDTTMDALVLLEPNAVEELEWLLLLSVLTIPRSFTMFNESVPRMRMRFSTFNARCELSWLRQFWPTHKVNEIELLRCSQTIDIERWMESHPHGELRSSNLRGKT